MQVFQKSLEDCTSKLASVEAMYKSWQASNTSDSTKSLQELKVHHQIKNNIQIIILIYFYSNLKTD